NCGRELLEALAEEIVVVGRPRVLSNAAPGRGPGARYLGPMVVIGQRHDGGLHPRHDPPRILPLLRLPMQVRHRPRVSVGEPAVQLLGVGVAIEPRDAGGGEAERRGAAFDLDHSPIVSRRQRAKFTTSSTGGTASSSPYAVNIRHCM